MKLAWCAVALLSFAVMRVLAEDTVTFNKDIAPIIFEHCAGCHRPGESGPFALLTYSDVKKRAKQIVDVTARRYMPPWLPQGDTGEFLGDRRLTSAQIELFRRWLQQGTQERASEDLPAPPHWTEGWQLGKPNLIVQMPRKYTLAAEGRDIYRNFVIRSPLQTTQYVRAVEFRPDNPRIVHHAFVKVDSSGRSYQLDGRDGQPGFGGMSLPDTVKMPSGYFLSYQPGKVASSEAPGFGWIMKPGQDLVIQAHLKPTGKPEELQAQIGLFFTEVPPTNTTLVLLLSSLSIDIPAGSNSWLLKDDFQLPVEVEVMAVLPHAHYLGKKLEGFAQLPDGSIKQLLSIPDWDFNWQGDYRYAHPIHLPAGTTLEMRYVYDNSATNPRNPNQPPKEVMYGAQSSDEMGELWFQARLAGTNAAARLAKAQNEKNARLVANYAEFRLRRNPHDAHARTELGFTEWTQGHIEQAMDSFRTACADDPTYDQPHYYIGVIYRTQNRVDAAQAEFEKTIQLNPKNSRAYGNLGQIFIALGELERAEQSVREAVRLDPTDELARQTLESLVGQKRH